MAPAWHSLTRWRGSESIVSWAASDLLGLDYRLGRGLHGRAAPCRQLGGKLHGGSGKRLPHLFHVTLVQLFIEPRLPGGHDAGGTVLRRMHPTPHAHTRALHAGGPHSPAPRRQADRLRPAPPPATLGTPPPPAPPARARASEPRRRLALAVHPCASFSAAGSVTAAAAAADSYAVAAAAAEAQTGVQWPEACVRPAKAAPMRTTRQRRQQSASFTFTRLFGRPSDKFGRETGGQTAILSLILSRAQEISWRERLLSPLHDLIIVAARK